MPPTLFDRRHLLKASGAAAMALPLAWIFGKKTHAMRGNLLPDPAGLLDLPPGFSYQVLQRVSDPMTDGYRVPARPDGMACFWGNDGTWVLMRNHELDYAQPLGAYDGVAPREAYDPKTFGGVSRVVLAPESLEVLSSNLVLTGTLRNCCGGPSPWGWLSCEEAVEPDHGFVFLCPSDCSRLAPPRKLPSYGRFNHEAVCIDPSTNIAYLTEDRLDGCLYRFVPERRATPFVGRLQALQIVGQPRFNTATELSPGRALRVGWVDVADPAPADDTLRLAAQAKGAASVCRAEGIWFHDGHVYICATSGGRISAGQIFQLTPGSSSADELRVVVEATDETVLDHPDNISVTPWGHILLAEDGNSDQFLRGLTPAGRIYDIARNAHSAGEFAGVCMSPDGSVLFVNLQGEGLTLAIRGPLATLGT